MPQPQEKGADNVIPIKINENEYKARIKSDARESRLSFRNRAEDLLRRDLKEEALNICKLQLGQFAECAQETGLMVVFRCQGKLKELNKCLAIHNGEEAWVKYKEKHKDVLERRARGQM